MSNEQHIQEKRVKLRKMEATYLRAQEYLKSPKANEDRLSALAKIESIMVHTHVEEGKALWILGRISQIIEDARVQTQVVLDYESAKKSLDELTAKG